MLFRIRIYSAGELILSMGPSIFLLHGMTEPFEEVINNFAICYLNVMITLCDTAATCQHSPVNDLPFPIRHSMQTQHLPRHVGTAVPAKEQIRK